MDTATPASGQPNIMPRNPYLNRSMVRSLGEFYGRSQALERIAAHIGAPTPQSISLVGERRGRFAAGVLS
jgi:hypothetical protein